MFCNFLLYFVGFYLNKHVLYKVNGIIFQLHCFWHSDKLYLQRPDLLGFQFGYQMGGICVVSRESRCWNCKNNTHCLRCANCKIARYCGAVCQKQDWRSHLILCRKIKSSISNNKEPTYESYVTEERLC